MNRIAESVPESVCMEALQLAGKIIMENGGETYRAEETIARMGKGFGLEEVESFAVPSGLFISCRGFSLLSGIPFQTSLCILNLLQRQQKSFFTVVNSTIFLLV